MSVSKIGFVFIILTIIVLTFRRFVEIFFSTGTYLNTLIIFSWKEVMVLSSGVLIVLKIFASRFRVPRLYLFEKIILLYSLYCLLRLMDSHGLIVGGYGLVKLVGWVPFYFAMRIFINSWNRLALLKKTIYSMLLIVLFSGIFIHLIGELEFRNMLEINSKIQSSILPDTFALTYKDIGEEKNTPRFEGIFFEPLIPAYMITILLIYLFIEVWCKKKWGIKNMILVILSFMALFLTYTRSAYISMAFAVLFLSRYLKLNRRILMVFTLLFIVGVGLTSSDFRYICVSTLSLRDGSAYEHFYGFFYIMPNLLINYPFGFGLGSTPEAASRIGLSFNVQETWGESFLSTIGGQIGLIGVIFYIFIVALVIIQLGIFYRRTHEKNVKDYIIFSQIAFTAIHVGALILPVIFDSVLRIFLWAILAMGMQAYVLNKRQKVMCSKTAFDGNNLLE